MVRTTSHNPGHAYGLAAGVGPTVADALAYLAALDVEAMELPLAQFLTVRATLAGDMRQVPGGYLDSSQWHARISPGRGWAALCASQSIWS